MKSPTTEQPDNCAIKAVNLKKTFGSLVAVDGLSLEVYRGEVFGFLGPNGAGKTTAINMICGLSRPTEGEVLVYGKKIRDRKNLRTHIGVCPQENIFWPKLTCLEQLEFIATMYDIPRKAAREKGNELLRLIGLTEKTHVLASKLSGGMKRRLNICLALVHEPDIVILDEPEAGLDPQSRIMVREFIKTMANHKTVILTTHNMDEADRLADRVAIIDHGKLLLLDTPENLKKSIGEGDILEIELLSGEQKHIDQAVRILSEICENVKYTRSALIIKSKHLIESVATIMQKLKSTGLQLGELKFRENTLEDVFIHLTGRKLRE